MFLKKIQYSLLYLYAFSLVFENWGIMNLAGNSIPKLIAYLLLFSLLLSPKNITSIIILKKYLIPLFTFAFLVAFSNYFDSGYLFLDGLSFVFTITLNIVLFWFIGNLIYNQPLVAEKMLFAIVVGITISTIIFALGYGVSYEFGRLTIFGENSNAIGFYAVFGLMYIISLIFENRNQVGRKRYLVIVFIFPLLGAAAGSGSRTAFIMLIVGLSLFFLLKSNKKFYLKAFSVIIGAIVVYLVYNYLLTFELLHDRLMSTIEEGNLAGRETIWRFSIRIITEHPLIGVGIGEFKNIAEQLYGSRTSPHNVYIEILLYSGFVGLFFFLLFLFRLLKTAFVTYRIQNYVLPIILLAMVGMVFFAGQGLNIKLFWVFYAFIIGAYSQENYDIRQLTPFTHEGS